MGGDSIGFSSSCLSTRPCYLIQNDLEDFQAKKKLKGDLNILMYFRR